MQAKNKERSAEWQRAIEAEFRSFSSLSSNVSVFGQLQVLFDDEDGCGETDEGFRRRVAKEYDLHVAIQGNEWRHLSPTAKDTYLLMQDVFKALPKHAVDEILPLEKGKFGFAQRGEQCVFQIWSSYSAQIVEIEVRTDNVEELSEFVYWAKDKLALISFVKELDEEHSLSQIYEV